MILRRVCILVLLDLRFSIIFNVLCAYNFIVSLLIFFVCLFRWSIQLEGELLMSSTIIIFLPLSSFNFANNSFKEWGDTILVTYIFTIAIFSWWIHSYILYSDLYPLWPILSKSLFNLSVATYVLLITISSVQSLSHVQLFVTS